MPKVKYDVSDVEPTGSDVVPAGVYPAVITACEFGPSSNQNDMFTIELTIKGGEHDGRKLWHYVLPKQAAFRMREFTDACGLPEKGSVDTDAVVGTGVQVRTKVEKSEEYGDQARVKNLLPGADADSDEEEVPYSEWEQSELADEIEARELKVSGRKTKAAMIRALEADDEAAEGDEDDESEEDEDEDGGITAEEIRVLDRSALKKLIKEDDELDIRVTTKMKDEDIAEAIIEALGLEDEDEPEEDDEEEEEEEAEEEDEAEDDDEDEAEEVDYSEWEIADLKAELKERGLKPDGKKALLVKRLEQDDASADKPF